GRPSEMGDLPGETNDGASSSDTPEVEKRPCMAASAADRRIRRIVTEKGIGRAADDTRIAGCPPDECAHSALRRSGYPCITVNTRMHDIGSVAGYRDGKRLRGGGCWGVRSEPESAVSAEADAPGASGTDLSVFGSWELRAPGLSRPPPS